MGMAAPKAVIRQKLQHFVKWGYNTFQLDFRAHGSSGGNTCTIGFDETEDVKLAYDYVKTPVKKYRVGAYPWVLPPLQKAINDYNLQPKNNLEMPFGTIEDAVKGRLKLMHRRRQPIATFTYFWGGTIHGFWAFGMKPEEYAKKYTVLVLLQWALTTPV